MKKRNNIYCRLLAPFLACLVLALAGCSKDDTEAETPSSSPGGTYLTIVTRGINTTDATQYEDYVGKLRILVFDSEGNKILNLPLTNGETSDIPDHEGDASTDASYVVLDEQNIGSISSGVYTFYCIANEDGYLTTGNNNLSDVLNDENIDTETLEDMQVKFTVDDAYAPTVGENKYMLMSTKQNVLIYAGEKNDVTIELIRAFAKVQLVIQASNEITDVNVSLPKDKIPGSYSLIKQETIGTISSTLGTDAITLSSTEDAPFYDEAKSEDNKYVSAVIYLPERSATDADDALYYNITIGNKSYDNVASIADGITDAANVDYNIERNYAYTTICTYSQSATLNTLTYTVQPWGQGGGEHTFN